MNFYDPLDPYKKIISLNIIDQIEINSDVSVCVCKIRFRRTHNAPFLTRQGIMQYCKCLVYSALWHLEIALCLIRQLLLSFEYHDDVIRWEKVSALLAFCMRNSSVIDKFPSQRPVTRGFDAPWLNGWVNNREAGDLRRHRAHHGVIVIFQCSLHRPRNGWRLIWTYMNVSQDWYVSWIDDEYLTSFIRSQRVSGKVTRSPTS